MRLETEGGMAIVLEIPALDTTGNIRLTIYGIARTVDPTTGEILSSKDIYSGHVVLTKAEQETLIRTLESKVIIGKVHDIFSHLKDEG